LQDARMAADGRERGLLTLQDEPLVKAAIECLRDLGFDVQDMDAVNPEHDRREDLRVHHSSHPGWVALVEVKGYKGGARANDLMQIGKWVKRYMQETKGVSPSATWYIVNQFRTRDPATRQPVLETNQAELETFASEDGLAIDTRDLFRLWRAVSSGALSAHHAAALLVGKTGRFEFT
jgi:hypothetical protein